MQQHELDQLCAAALQRLRASLNRSVAQHKRQVREGFAELKQKAEGAAK